MRSATYRRPPHRTINLAAGIDTAYIDPGKPWQNGLDESFNGKFRDECLSLEWFRTRPEVAVVIESWRPALQRRATPIRVSGS